jgi:small subunit ribosomal protein S21
METPATDASLLAQPSFGGTPVLPWPAAQGFLPVDSAVLPITLSGLTARAARQWGRLRLPKSGRGSEILTEIKLRKGEPVEKVLRRLKKRIDREGTLKEVRNHRHYEKPSERRRRKEKVARFSAMLSARYADM